MTFDEPNGASGAARVSVTLPRSSVRRFVAVMAQIAAWLSSWPKRTRPPSIPEAVLFSPHLRRDIGLPPDYEPRTWHEIPTPWPRWGDDLR